MFCTKCGSPNFDDAIVCKKCASPFAAKFTRPNRTVASQASGIKRLTIQLLGWGLIGATLIMGLVLVADLNDARNTPSSSAPSAYVAPAIEAPEEKAVSTGGFTDDELDDGLAAICTTLILNGGQSGAAMVERTQGLLCRRHKICGGRARKLLQATADHFGGWDEVGRKCEE
jgi:hypothetical protein